MPLQDPYGLVEKLPSDVNLGLAQIMHRGIKLSSGNISCWKKRWVSFKNGGAVPLTCFKL
jgi:hypothetical protein